MFELKHGDCLELMNDIEDQSIDLILCDLPYGTTACEWDSVIDLDRLWTHYRRIIKPYHAIVLTCSQPFTTVLAASNLAWLKYEWIWVKNRPTNFAHAKNKPMKKHENVLVFSEGTTIHEGQSEKRMPYYPQGLTKIRKKKFTRRMSEMTDAFFSARPGHHEFERDYTDYPNSVLDFDTDQLNLHPTAKPVALMEFLVRSYANKGDLVLDNCMGSGTTGVACAQSDRDFMGIELESDFFDIASLRVTESNDHRRSQDEPFFSFRDDELH